MTTATATTPRAPTIPKIRGELLAQGLLVRRAGTANGAPAYTVSGQPGLYSREGLMALTGKY